jgi:hypothetical protein
MSTTDIVKVVGGLLAAFLGVTWLAWSAYHWVRKTFRMARNRGAVLRTALGWLAAFVFISPFASVVWAVRARGTIAFLTAEDVLVGITAGVLVASGLAFRFARGPLCGRCKGDGKVRSRSGEWKVCSFCEGTGLLSVPAKHSDSVCNREHR